MNILKSELLVFLNLSVSINKGIHLKPTAKVVIFYIGANSKVCKNQHLKVFLG